MLTAEDEGHGDGDRSNDMDIDGTDEEDISEQAMEFASENQGLPFSFFHLYKYMFV